MAEYRFTCILVASACQLRNGDKIDAGLVKLKSCSVQARDRCEGDRRAVEGNGLGGERGGSESSGRQLDLLETMGPASWPFPGLTCLARGFEGN